MKTLVFILRKSIGIPLFVWLSVFLLWGMTVEYYSAPSFSETPYIIQTLTALDIVGLLLKLCFTGYLFSVAINVSKSKEKPLYPIALTNAFVKGVQLIVRLLFITLPLIIAELCLFGFNFGINMLTYVALFYVVFIICPYIIMITGKSDSMPYIKGFWSFFKKNANLTFAYLFWSALSFVIYDYFSLFIYQLADQYSTTQTTLFLALFIPFFTLFYVLFFNAVLLGVFTKKVFEEKKEATPTESQEKRKKDTKK